MSCFFIIGFFALAEGRRVATNRLTSNTKVWHRHYTTTIQCSSGVVLPADLRVYSPVNDVGLRDFTVAFVVAKAYTPLNDTIQLDAHFLVPFSGDPDSDEYQDSIPDMPYPFVFGVGHVPKRFELLPDGKSKGFAVSFSEYVRDSVRHSAVQ